MKHSDKTSKYLLLLIIVSLLPWCWGYQSQSTSYQLLNSGVDAGGIIATGTSHKIKYQSTASIFKEQGNNTSEKIYSGIYFSSHVTNIYGVAPLMNQVISFTASANGTLLSDFEYQLSEDQTSELIDFVEDRPLNKDNNYLITWDSVEDIGQSTTVNIKARAFDGLTWGPWTTKTFRVDNLPPTIKSLIITNPYFSNLNSLGVKDTTEFNIEIDDPNFKNVSILLSEEESESEIKSQVETESTISWEWDGSNNLGDKQDTGRYEYLIRMTDMLDQVSTQSGVVTIDNEDPVLEDINLIATGLALNSQQGRLDASLKGNDNIDKELEYFGALKIIDNKDANKESIKPTKSQQYML